MDRTERLKERLLHVPGHALLILAATSISITGCNVEGLAFRQDNRLKITSPVERTTVDLPMRIRWNITDFDITGPDGSAQTDAGRFAVFVDRTPVGPGVPISEIAKDDDECERTRGCPDKEYYNARGVYLTERTSLAIRFLEDTEPEDGADVRERHEVVIILVNGRDVRIGEAFASTEFFVRRSQNARSGN